MAFSAQHIMLAAAVVPGFVMWDVWWTLLFGIAFAIVNSTLSPLLHLSGAQS